MSLTTIEQNNLAELEQTISKHLNAFYEVGFALMQIRDNKLYREQYGTFEEYCKGKWNISRPRAYQLIAAAEVHENLSTQVDISDTDEKSLRPLTRIKDPDQQREVYRKAVETAPDGKITARHIEETVKEIKGEPKPRVDKWVNVRSEPERMSDEFKREIEKLQIILYNERETGWKTTSRDVAVKYLSILLDSI